MTPRTRIALFWLVALAFFVGFLLIFRSILLPFVAGMILAYALDPVADWMVKRGMNRLAATIIILCLFLIVFLTVILALGPVLVNQLADLVTRIPSYVEQIQDLAGFAINSKVAAFLGLDPNDLGNSIRSLIGSGADIFRTFVQSLWSGGRAVASIASLLVITPFVMFYLLRDWERMIAWIDDLLPREHAVEIRRIATEIDAKVAAFVRGQLLVGLVLGLFYAIGLLILGVNYGLLIGLVSGFLSFVPYLGFTVGFALSAIVSIVQFWPDWIWPAATIGLYLIGQFIEGYVLYPRILGRGVGMHPVWLFFALFAFGLLFGFVGLLIAVPAAAAVGVLFRHAIERYRESAMYRGPDNAAGDGKGGA